MHILTYISSYPDKEKVNHAPVTRLTGYKKFPGFSNYSEKSNY